MFLISKRFERVTSNWFYSEGEIWKGERSRSLFAHYIQCYILFCKKINVKIALPFIFYHVTNLFLMYFFKVIYLCFIWEIIYGKKLKDIKFFFVQKKMHNYLYLVRSLPQTNLKITIFTLLIITTTDTAIFLINKY